MMAQKGRRGRKPSKKKAGHQPGVRTARFAMAESDFGALQHIGIRHGHRADSAALRFAVLQQFHRDKAIGVLGTDRESPADAGHLTGRLPPRAWYHKRTRDVWESLGGPTRGRPAGQPAPVELRQWSCLLYDEDDGRVREIADAWGFDSAVDAIRLSIRVQAILDGWTPPAGGW